MPQHYALSHNNQRVFECDLASMQCEANGKTGKRCSNKTVIGVKLCWQHLRGLKHLRIKQSTVAGAGKGVFADDPRRPAGAVVFAKDSVIIEYDGERMNSAKSLERYKNMENEERARYLLIFAGDNVDNDKIVDGACMRSVGSMIVQNVESMENVIMTDSAAKPFVVKATRDIVNGDELFCGRIASDHGKPLDQYKATWPWQNTTVVRSPKRAAPAAARRPRKRSSSQRRRR